MPGDGYGFGGLDYQTRYGTLSVCDKFMVPVGSTTLTKSNYKYFSEFYVVFIPVSIRNITNAELRPYWTENSTSVTITRPTNSNAHVALLLGR